MNVLGKGKRSWRKARKRGVSPIIATILLVAITVVLAAVLYVLISGLTSGGANTVPIGTAFSFGTASQNANVYCAVADRSPGSCYTVAIGSTGSAATTTNVHFGVLKAGAGIPFVRAGIVSISGSLLATYTTGGGWVVSGTNATLPVSFSGTQTLVLDFGASSASGDSFEAIGVGALQGVASVPLP
jgi:archaeal type IV pilus assembly protein PilA